MKKLVIGYFICFFGSIFLYAEYPAPASRNLEDQIPLILMPLYPDLSKSIKSFSISGIPGKLKVFGSNAFPILADSKQNAVAAGFTDGEGRGIVFSHPEFMNPSKWKSPQNKKFFDSVNQWLLAKTQTKRVWIQDFKEISSYYLSKKFQTEQGKTLPEDLSKYGLLVLSFKFDSQNLSQEEILKLRTYLQRGGTLIAWGIGWVWRQYSETGKGQAPISEYQANRFFEPLGIQFQDWYAENQFDPSLFPAEKTHALLTLSHIFSLINNPRTLSLTELNTFISWCYETLPAFSYPNALISEKQISALKSLYQKTFKTLSPSEKFPVKPEQVREILLIMVLNGILKSYHTDSEFNLLEDFPGKVASSPVEETFQVKLSFSAHHQKWQSTGFYAPPGKTLKYRIPKEWVSKGLIIRVGVHQDRLFPFSDRIKEWQRWPDLVWFKTISEETLTWKHLHGGLITIEMAKSQNLTEEQELTLEVSGAVRAPYFKLGETSLEDWKNQTAKSLSPWGELEGKNIILSLPAEVLKKIQDPETLMKWWDRVIPLYAELSGEEPHPYKERIVPDRQITMGYMHSGYPIMTHLDAAEFSAALNLSPAEKENLMTQGSWGHFHELGHNYQLSIYTFDGAGEVVVNLFTLYAMEKMTGLSPEKHRFLKTRHEKMKNYFATGPSYDKWKKDYSLALNTFLVLIENLGWEPFKQTLRRFKSLELQKKTLSDEEKRTYWVWFLSESSGYNLAPYFESWAIPFDVSIKSRIAKLKPFKNFLQQ